VRWIKGRSIAETIINPLALNLCKNYDITVQGMCSLYVRTRAYAVGAACGEIRASMTRVGGKRYRPLLRRGRGVATFDVQVGLGCSGCWCPTER
jgi:hypothetical protein